jgi:hypothetical protein
LAEINCWEINSFDVSTVYLHSPIDEEIYVWPPVELCPELKEKLLVSPRDTSKYPKDFYL